MKKVQVHPERCLGCRQCMFACAAAHSRSQEAVGALAEQPRPRARVHVAAVGRHYLGFPNRCHHCEPAPCLLACLPGAISREPATGTVMIDPDLCINCASCAMACPFGVLRYAADWTAPAAKTVAITCDNCLDRQLAGRLPACVEACKTGALTFEESDVALERKSREVARSLAVDGERETLLPPTVALLLEMKNGLAASNDAADQ